MKIHEYQSKEILKSIGVSVPEQYLAQTPDDAKLAASSFSNWCVVKAQIHSGGRGKAGGVIICDNPEEAYLAAEKLLGHKLYTAQTAPEGLPVSTVLVTAKMEIEQELYLAVAADLAKPGFVVLASLNGGMEIEDVAQSHPEQIIRTWIPVNQELKKYQIQYLADKLAFNAELKAQLSTILATLLEYMRTSEATLIELNPLAVTDNNLIAADAKIVFDDNALFRHPEIKALEDLTQIEPLEREAREIGLAYVKMQGNIACLVNGAGLAMATMDIIKCFGGTPANFMDVGGGVGVEKVTAAFKLIMKDSNVRSIFVNIFGGIARCDIIAEGIVEAIRQTELTLPLIVRLRGTNEDKGRQIFRESGLALYSIEDFTTAAQKAVECANGVIS